MRHDIHIEGFGLRLRPVRMEDAAFIVWLRNLEHVRGRVGDSAANIENQTSWLNAYFDREGDYYFISETLGGKPLGTHGIYDLRGTTAEKGRQVMRPDMMAGVPTAVLATDIAFGRLKLTELRSTTVSTNRPVRSLHLKSGFRQTGIVQGAQVIDGKPVDLVQFSMTADEWFKVRDGLLPLATLAGEQVAGWEKAQTGKHEPWLA